MRTKNEAHVLELNTTETDNKILLNYSTLKRAVLTLRAVNHPLRKEIMSLIEGKGKMNLPSRSVFKTSAFLRIAKC